MNSKQSEEIKSNQAPQERSVSVTLETRNTLIRNLYPPHVDEKFEDIPMTQSVSFSFPSRQTTFGYSITKAIPLIHFNPKTKQFCIPEVTEQLLSGFEKPCYVLSVSGNPLVGKSSLLNLLISYLTYHSNDSLMYSDAGDLIPYQQIYQVGDGKRSTTEGIDMYCINLSDKNILIMDIEGDNDPNRKDMGVWMYTNFITTAVALSHAHLYNYTGLPQQSFMDYFRSINKLTKGNKFHADFNTVFCYLKKNHPVYDEDDLEEDLDEISEYFETNFEDIYQDGCIKLLKTPPEHIINQKSTESCIKNTGFICKQCQDDIFFRHVTQLFEDLINMFDQTPSYQNGSKVLEVVGSILEINHRDLPFTADLGHLSKIRLSRLRKEQNRITKEMLEVQPQNLNRNLSKQVQELIEDNPGLSDAKILEDFEAAILVLTTKIAQLEYFMPELTKFVEETLLDRTQTILDIEEKDLIMDIYIRQFQTLSKDIIDSIRKYQEITSTIVVKMKELEKDISENIKKYIDAVFEAKRRTTLAVTNIASSSVLGLVARELGVQVFAGFILGGGVLGAALTVAVFVRAKKKFDKEKQKNKELINASKVEGIESVEQAEEEMQKIAQFILETVRELEEKKLDLDELCQEEKSKNLVLAEQLEQLIDNKMNCIEMSLDDQVKTIQSMKVAQNNLERFKNCI